VSSRLGPIPECATRANRMCHTTHSCSHGSAIRRERKGQQRKRTPCRRVFIYPALLSERLSSRPLLTNWSIKRHNFGPRDAGRKALAGPVNSTVALEFSIEGSFSPPRGHSGHQSVHISCKLAIICQKRGEKFRDDAEEYARARRKDDLTSLRGNGGR